MGDLRVLCQNFVLAGLNEREFSLTKIFVDGASRGNPGPAAAGVVFQDEKGKVLHLISRKIGVTTNNVAEYSALIFALQGALILGLKEVQIFTDSELLARQFSGDYKVRDAFLKLLANFVSHLCAGFKKVSLTHVPREENRLADAEANRALDGESFL
jgi:ribonuclease HI